jgi:uncharacterized protein (DUF1800 family)
MAHPRLKDLLLLVTAIAALLALAPSAMAQKAPAPDRNEIIHVLNRITFGPRPGDVEMVQKMGLNNYIQQQLHPETIDDSAVDQALAQLPLMQMSAEQLAALYVDEKKMAKEKKAETGGKKAKGEPVAPMATTSTDTTAMASTAPAATPAPELNANGKIKKHAAKLANAGPKADEWRSDAAIEQLEQAKLIRAVDSNRQLQEVLADFWNNHFNVDVKKKECRIFKVADDRETIRPHIWGKFRDLLEADAKSPAMLVYLDNASNTAPKGSAYDEPASMIAQAGAPAPPPRKVKKKKAGGINENYAREVMELHTLGVDGGYTQQDVQEVARCFTGWTVKKGTGEFEFNAKVHDNGAKVVLGHNIPAGGGMKDGETVLDILAFSPATAHHISLELCQRFISDTPPEALVKRIADVFTKTGGDLRQVTTAILASPEFLSPSDYGNKIKSPLEFAVSAVRASGSTLIPGKSDRAAKRFASIEGDAIRGKTKSQDKIGQSKKQSLNWHIAEMGQPLFACTPPTGYKEVSSTWVSPGALIERLNFATALTHQELSDVSFSAKTIIGNTDLDKPDDVLNQSVAALIPNNITDNTRKVLEKNALPSGDSKTVNPNQLIALIIGSPEFQRK